jgi:methionyl-tRNA synthetase
MPQFDFVTALSAIWKTIDTANKLIEDAKPWALAKDNKTEELSSPIYALLEVLRIISVSVYPVMPRTASNIRAQLGVKDSPGGLSIGSIKKWGVLSAGDSINKSNPLFPRIC